MKRVMVRKEFRRALDPKWVAQFAEFEKALNSPRPRTPEPVAKEETPSAVEAKPDRGARLLGLVEKQMTEETT